jgi:hypothetical protein
LRSALAQSLFIQIIEPKQKSSRLEKVSIVKITNEKEQSRNQNNHQKYIKFALSPLKQKKQQEKNQFSRILFFYLKKIKLLH